MRWVNRAPECATVPAHSWHDLGKAVQPPLKLSRKAHQDPFSVHNVPSLAGLFSGREIQLGGNTRPSSSYSLKKS